MSKANSLSPSNVLIETKPEFLGTLMLTDNDDLPPLQQQAIEWLLRLRSHELTESEIREFADWLSFDLSHTQAFAKAEDLFDVMAQALQMPALETNPSPFRLSELAFNTAKPAPPKNRLSRWMVIPLALAASWLFVVNLVLPKQASLWDVYLSDYHTGTGEQRSVQLADGSSLFLNTDTAVSVDFQNTSRHIILHHGQVQFTVAADPSRPFTVSTDELQVRALGTVFEVYQQASGDTDISVQEHAVAASQLVNGNTPKTTPLLIKQGQQLHYTHGSDSLNQPEPADSELIGAWKQRRVIIKDRPLGELVAEIERYRKGRIF